MTDRQSITAQRATKPTYVVSRKTITGIHYHLQAIASLECTDPESDLAALQSYAQAFSYNLLSEIADQGGLLDA